MSNLENRVYARDENPYAEKFANAMASIEAEKLKKEAAGYAWMAAMMNYGEAAESESRFGKFARGSKWFVIWFAMIVAPLLFWRVAF